MRHSHPISKSFFLLALGRSGSTWLGQTLNNHPQISCLKEPTNTPITRCIKSIMCAKKGRMRPGAQVKWMDRFLPPLRYYMPIKKLQFLLSTTDKEWSGAKIVWEHAMTDISFYQFMQDYKEAKFIVLERENLTEAICSFYFAESTGYWHVKQSREDLHKKMYIPIDNAKNSIMRRLWQENMISSAIMHLGVDAIFLSYEKLMADKQGELARIAGFLGVSAFQQQSELKKVVQQPYSEIIDNYYELIELERNMKAHIIPNG